MGDERIAAGNVEYISREDLSAILLGPNSASVSVIDVRDIDYPGGHIKGGMNIPSSEIDWRAAELVRTLRDKDIVVFHCRLSQVRGPDAARDYAKAKKTMDGEKCTEQKILVLEGGWEKWVIKYGRDARLTEEYDEDLWEGHL